MTSRSGSCLCGSVRFAVDGDLPPLQVCHCVQCRKAQGAAFAAVMPLTTSQLRFLSGRDVLREFESSAGNLRAFCSRCGSPVYSRRDDLPDVLRLRVGLLDGPLHVKVAAHAYVASKADWFEISDDAPQFAGARDAAR